MTGDHRKAPTTLRALAKHLGHQHSALHKAVHQGRLTAGVGFDDDGNIVVTDARAAVRQWRDLHVPTTNEMIRRDDRKRRPAMTGPQWAADEWDGLDLIVAVIAGAAISSGSSKAFVSRTTALLRSAVRRGYGSDEMLASALALLAERVDDPVPVEEP